MVCTNCGKEVEKGNFCPNCGNKLEGNDNGRKVTLTVTRNKRMLGFAISFPVIVDDMDLGKLKNGQSLTCEVSEGIHTVKFKCVEKTVEQEITINSSTNSVEVICQAKMGLAAAIADILDVKYN